MQWYQLSPPSGQKKSVNDIVNNFFIVFQKEHLSLFGYPPPPLPLTGSRKLKIASNNIRAIEALEVVGSYFCPYFSS